MVVGFSHYTPWEELSVSTVPHILYGTLLYGKSRYDLDDHHLSSGSGQHPEHRYVLYRSDLFRYGKS